MADYNHILIYWFEGIDDQTPIDKGALPFRKWFAQNKKIDEEIRQRFEPELIKANQGEYRDWDFSARGRLALIILFDQFSRNMYRNTFKMFEFDTKALELSLRTVKEKLDAQLLLIEKVFLFMPFMHSEDLKIQELSVECFEQLAEFSRRKYPSNAFYFETTLQYAKKHWGIIKQFERFPRRNAILNRLSSREEKKFLESGVV